MAARTVCVRNKFNTANPSNFKNGLSFRLKNISRNSFSDRTKPYYPNVIKCIDLSTIPHIKYGDWINAQIHNNIKKIGNFTYNPNASVVHITCYGTPSRNVCTVLNGNPPDFLLSTALAGSAPPIDVKQVCIVNNTHFDMKFKLRNVAQGGDSYFDNVLMNDLGCIDLNAIMGIEQGHIVLSWIQPLVQNGTGKLAGPALKYNKYSGTVTLFCAGNPTDFSCKAIPRASKASLGDRALQASLGDEPFYPEMKASKVCISNNALFVMRYRLLNETKGSESSRSKWYAMTGHICLNLNSLKDINSGDIVRTEVNTYWGVTKKVGPVLLYHEDAGTAVFTCTGNTLWYNCKPLNDHPIVERNFSNKYKQLK